MNKAKPGGVKRLPVKLSRARRRVDEGLTRPKSLYSTLATIGRVTDKGRSDMSHVHTYLVRAAGLQATFN